MDSKLRHDINSDIESIFDCIKLLIELEDLPEEAKEGLGLILVKRAGLKNNLEKIFDPRHNNTLMK